ncbi:ribonuclease H-like domain-containing protein [Tanacetum coccineum]
MDYNSWTSFFKIHLRSIGFKHHIESAIASSTNKDWSRLDDLVKVWILGTCCESLQDEVVTTPGTTKDLWDHIKGLFHGNEDDRTITLDNQLRSIKIGDLYPVTKPSPIPHAFLPVSPTTWHQHLGHPGEEVPHYALRVGFSSIRCVSSLFIYRHGAEVAYLLIYVDDIILTTLLQQICFRSFRHGTYGVDTESKLGSDGDLACLQMHDPREPRFAALKRVLCYVRGTLDLGLQLYASSTGSIVAYYDVDWVGCHNTRRSTSSYCVLLGIISSHGHLNANILLLDQVLRRGVANAVAETT